MFRHWITLCEDESQPWFREGTPLAPADLDRLDVAEFVEGDEWDYDWRLCQLPLDLVPALSDSQILAMDEREPGRMDSIRNWLRQTGPEALLQRPVVALWTRSGRIKLLDGSHRVTASKELKFPFVWAAVAVGDPVV